VGGGRLLLLLFTLCSIWNVLNKKGLPVFKEGLEPVLYLAYQTPKPSRFNRLLLKLELLLALEYRIILISHLHVQYRKSI